jgi:hypothetical protein
MKDTVTLKLTRAEAMALDELANNSAEKFFCTIGGEKDYGLVGWDKETAASACDKLRNAVMGEERPAENTWAHFLANVLAE